MLLISTLLAVLLYLVAATLQWTVLKGNKRTSGFAVRAVATTAVVLHTFRFITHSTSLMASILAFCRRIVNSLVGSGHCHTQ